MQENRISKTADEAGQENAASLGKALKSALINGDGKGQHYSFEELKSMLERRRSWGEFWEMPEHLAECPQCLDLFESLLEGEEEAGKELLGKLERLLRWRSRLFIFKLDLPRLLKIAAAIAIIGTATLLLSDYLQAPSVKLVEGSLLLDDGSVYGEGSSSPQGVATTAAQDAVALFDDGSKVMAAAQTHLSFLNQRFGDKLVQLTEGSIVCEVSKQAFGRSFKVLTPAGEVTVIGTRFKVESSVPRGKQSQSSEKNLRFIRPMELGVEGTLASSSLEASVVKVTVERGIVSVRNRQGSEVRLGAGQTGVLKNGQSVIDVFTK